MYYLVRFKTIFLDLMRRQVFIGFKIQVTIFLQSSNNDNNFKKTCASCKYITKNETLIKNFFLYPNDSNKQLGIYSYLLRDIRRYPTTMPIKMKYKLKCSNKQVIYIASSLAYEY